MKTFTLILADIDAYVSLLQPGDVAGKQHSFTANLLVSTLSYKYPMYSWSTMFGEANGLLHLGYPVPEHEIQFPGQTMVEHADYPVSVDIDLDPACRAALFLFDQCEASREYVSVESWQERRLAVDWIVAAVLMHMEDNGRFVFHLFEIKKGGDA